MNAWDLLKSIGVFAAGSTVLLPALGFIARNVFVHFLSHDLESHKAKVAADNALALEQFKAQLGKAAFEYERLHERRFVVLERLYGRLCDAHLAFVEILAPFLVGDTVEHENRVKVADEKARMFFRYFNSKRIYFDEKLCRIIDEMTEPFARASAEASGNLGYGHLMRSKPVPDEVRKAFNEKVGPLQRELVARARILLGVSEYAEP
jgi:hypothetical protein